MKRALLLAGLLLLSACDKDRLPDDLTQVEGRESADDTNLAEDAETEAPPPAATNEAVENPTAESEVTNDEPPATADDPLAAVDSNPSFDCTAASNRVERHICNVPELGALDRKVSAAFDRAMGDAGPDQGDRLRNLGRQYLADRNRCRDDYCIRQAYRWYERDIYNLMGWQGPN